MKGYKPLALLVKAETASTAAKTLIRKSRINMHTNKKDNLQKAGDSEREK